MRSRSERLRVTCRAWGRPNIRGWMNPHPGCEPRRMPLRRSPRETPHQLRVGREVGMLFVLKLLLLFLPLRSQFSKVLNIVPLMRRHPRRHKIRAATLSCSINHEFHSVSSCWAPVGPTLSLSGPLAFESVISWTAAFRLLPARENLNPARDIPLR
jgi:hypothetical protein